MDSHGPEYLQRMVHDIANNLRGGRTEAETAAAVADHLKRFWTPGMRQRLVDIARDQPEGLAPEVREAVALL